MRGAGLEVTFVSSFVCSLLPAMAFSRLLSRRTFGMRELRRTLVPGPLNAPFGWMLDTERRLVAGRGVSPPVGGSLVLIATRPR